MVTNISLFLIFIALTSATAQTFQYSRGWTNGKRAHNDVRDVSSNLEKILNPCQLSKLKYVLEGKPLNERLFVPCDYTEDEEQKRYKNDRPDLFDAFQ